ncbi:hypothetical protein ACMFMF_003513 [Clarireedia jacksonii]
MTEHSRRVMSSSTLHVIYRGMAYKSYFSQSAALDSSPFVEDLPLYDIGEMLKSRQRPANLSPRLDEHKYRILGTRVGSLSHTELCSCQLLSILKNPQSDRAAPYPR